MSLTIICGLNGSGKSTKAAQIRHHYQSLGEQSVVIHFPRYERLPGIKELLQSTTLQHDEIQELHQLLLRDLQDGEQEVVELLAQGIHVVLDRFYTSYNVYGLIRDPYHECQFDSFTADQKRTIYCRVDPIVAQQRILQRDGHCRFTLDQLQQQSLLFDQFMDEQ